ESIAQVYLQELQHAQDSAPFADGMGIVASTLDGDGLAPIFQCAGTPFQCIPERVGLAATVWAILAARNGNPFLTPARAKHADFNSDGHPDLVWQNEGTRQATVWDLGGAHGNVRQAWDWLSM